MVVELNAVAGHLGYFLKAEIVLVLFFKGKDDVYEFRSDLHDPGDPLFSVGDADHGFCRVQADLTNCFKLLYKMIEQAKAVFRFTFRKHCNFFFFGSFHETRWGDFKAGLYFSEGNFYI